MDSAGKHNVSAISAHSRQVAAGLGSAYVTLGRYVYICAGEIASSLSAHKTQGFVAGHSVAYAFITELHCAGPVIDRTSEENAAMERYGTVGMNYIQFSAYYRSCDGAGRRSTNVERDN